MSSWRPCAGGPDRIQGGRGAPPPAHGNSFASLGSRRPAAALALALLVAAPAARGASHELRGTLDLVDERGRVAAGADPAEAVVWFRPRGDAAKPAPGHFEMITRGKEFVPHVLTVPVGSTVRFPNADPILHNVFSASEGNAFDLGLYRKGPGQEAVFAHPGLVRVFCNVHHSMVAYILVVDTAFFTTPDSRGAFALGGLPAGEGTLSVWHERAEKSTSAVRVPAAGAVRLRLAATKPRVPPHLNKFGRSYWQAGRDRYQR